MCQIQVSSHMFSDLHQQSELKSSYDVISVAVLDVVVCPLMHKAEKSLI